MPYVYLIHEESMPRNHYKIGMTNRNSYERLSEYGMPEIICIQQVENPADVEKIIIKEFTQRYGSPVRGRETFKGTKRELHRCFMTILNNIKFNRPTTCPVTDDIDRRHRWELETADPKTFNENYCLVCEESTLDDNGIPLPNVLLCGDGINKGCNRDCHLHCANLISVPDDDWYCCKCQSCDNNHKKTCWSIANTRRELEEKFALDRWEGEQSEWVQTIVQPMVNRMGLFEILERKIKTRVC